MEDLIAEQEQCNHSISRIVANTKKLGEAKISSGALIARTERLQALWKDFSSRHTDLLAYSDEKSRAHSYFKNQFYDQTEELYLDQLGQMLDMQTSLSAKVPGSTSSTSSSPAAPGPMPQVQPPRLSLPVFSGNSLDWRNFRDLFSSMIVDRADIPPVQKLQYLKSCLEGEPAQLLGNLPVTADNFTLAWDTLNNRYDNRRLLINAQVSSLLQIKPVNSESVSELRRMYNATIEALGALEALQCPVQHWDVLTVHLTVRRLDPQSLRDWETDQGDRTDPSTFKDLKVFVENRIRALEAYEAHSKSSFKTPKASQASHLRTTPKSEAQRPPTRSVSQSFHSSVQSHSPALPDISHSRRCSLCSQQHYITSCPTFKSKPLFARKNIVTRLSLCYNCLGSHPLKECKSERRCVSCRKRHNTLLHAEETGSSRCPKAATEEVSKEAASSSKDGSTSPSAVAIHMANQSTAGRRVLLATARVRLIGPDGHVVQCRALLDQGSEFSFVSEAVAQLLHLPKRRVSIPLAGLAAVSTGVAKHSSVLRVLSNLDPDLDVQTEVLILPKLTNRIPLMEINKLDLASLADLPLADSDYGRPSQVGMILGADLYGRILRDGVRSIPNTGLTAQNTSFGWVISGPIGSQSSNVCSSTPLSSFHCVSNADIFQVMERFWSMEEIPATSSIRHPDDDWCEEHFSSTHSRDKTGRYVVRLPWKTDPPQVAYASHRVAETSFSALTRRLQKDRGLAKQYTDFMTEYERLGHMSKIREPEVENARAYYLPHHPVIQRSGTNEKLRVVFDASRPVLNGLSLNDFLHAGPALQTDLSLLVLEWRRYLYVFSADIVKMFRQIWVHAEDQDRQRILWSGSSSAPSAYRLLTVTYGTKCAPFLAIRTLRQLAEDEGPRFPLGAYTLVRESYVDDILSGADDLDQALERRDQLIQLLASGGFVLDKWAANHTSLLAHSPHSSISQASSILFDPHQPVKTLGIIWIPSEDSFSFQIPRKFQEVDSVAYRNPTKRSLLSCLASIFDPLGWISPLTVTAKILIQDLWLLGLDWDECPPFHLQEQWRELVHSFRDLSLLRIPRWSQVSKSALGIHLHGFADTSKRAYAASVFLRVVSADGHCSTVLLIAKSKVAPVKTVSIPRLELCSAVLLVRLLLHVRQVSSLSSIPVTMWLDSEVALHWIHKHPSTWATFVANRVSFIQTSLPGAKWCHVSSQDNPADLATRGMTARELRESALWWHGPAWLQTSSDNWPSQPKHFDTITAEESAPLVVLTANEVPDFSEILSRFSSLNKLVRVIAYCLRFLPRTRDLPNRARSSFLGSEEIKEAQERLIILVQASSFPAEIAALRANSPISVRSKILSLNPFLDSRGILRVGGRLRNAYRLYNERHPPILPKESPLSLLFVSSAHHRALHGGPSLTLGLLLQKVWILGAVGLVKRHIRLCVVCHRHRPKLGQQRMGDLPATRLTPCRPFSKAGVDYAGPISLLACRGRGQRTYKGYICLFVCFVTKAVHLEVVSDAASIAFLAAFRRFCGRRGLPNELFSDNSTTFRGADAELRSLFRASSDFYSSVSQVLAQDGVTWKFIPPQAPHFGGLWEAGVRSVKMHLLRVIGEQKLTFEELSTFLTQVEACLNSRPLCPQTSDPDDLNILSPAHFLIGSSLMSVPEPSLEQTPTNHLTRWQLLQRMHQHFWRRWSREYLHLLQQRFKWRSPRENFQVGQMVLIQDERYPPSKWPLGRVIHIHPGADGQVRVVSVRTASNVLKRPISRLSILPIPPRDAPQ